MRPGHLTQARTTLNALTVSIATAMARANQQAEAHDYGQALQTLLDYELHFNEALKKINESHKSKTPEKFKKELAELEQLKTGIQSFHHEMAQLIRQYQNALDPISTPPRETPAVAQPQSMTQASILNPPSVHVELPVPPQDISDPKRLLIPLNINEPHQREYATAYLNLTALKLSDIYPATKASVTIKRHLELLLRYVETLNNSGKELITTLTMVLEDTLAMLKEDKGMTPKEYHKKANAMQGKPSLGLNILGGLMMALAVAAIAAAVALAATGFGVVLATTSAVTGAVALTMGGLSFFAAHRTGLSKAMTCIVDDEMAHRKQSAAIA